MVRIENLMNELVKGIVEVKLEKDEAEFELKPTEDHHIRILCLYKKEAEQEAILLNAIKTNKVTKDLLDQRAEIFKEQFTEKINLIKDVIKSSYNQFNEEQISSINREYGAELYDELTIFYGLVDREMREKQRKAMLKALKNLEEGKESPQ